MYYINNGEITLKMYVIPIFFMAYKIFSSSCIYIPRLSPESFSFPPLSFFLFSWLMGSFLRGGQVLGWWWWCFSSAVVIVSFFRRGRIPQAPPLVRNDTPRALKSRAKITFAPRVCIGLVKSSSAIPR